jgi:hypothetical protein
LALVGFLGFVNLYALRVNLSVGMVCMVNQTAVAQMSAAAAAAEALLLNGDGANDSSPIVTRDWSHCAVQAPANSTARVRIDNALDALWCLCFMGAMLESVMNETFVF